MRTHSIALAFIALTMPVAAFAYGKIPLGQMSAKVNNSTSGSFMDRYVWLPGTWTVKTTSGSLTFTSTPAMGNRTPIVTVSVMDRNDCAFGIVRIRALKAWGGFALDQSQARIQAISFGTSRFKGYTWIEPSTWSGTHHWCVAQDLKTAFDIAAPEGETSLINFIKNDMLLQLVVRRGRSVLPWPQASGSASSSSTPLR